MESSSELASRLSAKGYEIRGVKETPENGIPAGSFVYVAGHHSELARYGHVRFVEGMWRTGETEIAILPPEVFFG